MKRIWKNYSLGIVLLAMFLISWGGQAFFQYREEYDKAVQEGQQLESIHFVDTFMAATLENWQSEFLQLLTMAVLTSFLIFKGSTESRDGEDEIKERLKKIEKKLGVE